MAATRPGWTLFLERAAAPSLCFTIFTFPLISVYLLRKPDVRLPDGNSATGKTEGDFYDHALYVSASCTQRSNELMLAL